MRNRKLFSKSDLPILAIIVFICTLALFLTMVSPSASVAVIEYDGQVIFEQDYTALTEPVVKEIVGDSGISLQIRIDRFGICVTDSQCPDKVCVRSGTISRRGSAAICLPARLSCYVRGGEKGSDAVAY